MNFFRLLEPSKFLLIQNFLSEKAIYKSEDQIDSLKTKIRPIIGRSIKDEEFINIIKLKDKEFEDLIKKSFNEFRNKRIQSIKKPTNLELERRVFLQTIDFLWRSHLQYLEHLRQAVGLRGYA